MAKWEIEYYDEGTSAFVPLAAEIDQVDEDESDYNATFLIPNTAASRLLIQQDLIVNVWFDSKLQFTGILSGGDILGGRIKAICYEPIGLILDQYDTFTKAYDQKAANLILTDLLSGTGLSLDASAPTTPISVVFYNANRLDVLKFIAATSGDEYWSDDGVTIKFGTRGGTTYTPTTRKLSRRGIDRSKQVEYVRVRGVDSATGYHIVGAAGVPGGRTKVFEETTPTDVAGLNAIAAKKLAELQTDSSGAPIVVLMTAAATSDNEGADLRYGDSVHIEDARYLLNGDYRILQITKTKTKATIQVDKARKSIDKEIADLKASEKKGIYLPGSTSWSLNLQGLVGLYHLNEGEGTDAHNRAPIDEPEDGVITNGHWEDGPTAKVLTLQGDGSVNIGNDITFAASGPGAVGKFSVGCWFSPSSLNAAHRYLISKSGQFMVSHFNTGTNGQLRFVFTDSGGGNIDFDSDLGMITVGGRLFVIITYDGANLKMYINGQLHKTQAQTGNIYGSTSNVYFGSGFQGVLAECMLWQRALVDQEVLELYFFPLLRVVGGGSGSSSSSGWYCTIQVAGRGGTTDPSGFIKVDSGQPLEVEATIESDNYEFEYWEFNGVSYSVFPSVIIPEQADGSYHTLVAYFKQIGAEFDPVIINIDDGDISIGEQVYVADELLIGDEGAPAEDALKAEPILEDDSAHFSEAPNFPTNGKMGNSGTSANGTDIENYLAGSIYTTPVARIAIANITAWILCSSANKTMKIAIYDHATLAKLCESAVTTVTYNAAAQRVKFIFAELTYLEPSTEILIVVSSQSTTGSALLHYTAGSANQGHIKSMTYSTFPNPIVTPTENSNNYCIEINYWETP